MNNNCQQTTIVSFYTDSQHVWETGRQALTNCVSFQKLLTDEQVFMADL